MGAEKDASGFRQHLILGLPKVGDVQSAQAQGVTRIVRQATEEIFEIGLTEDFPDSYNSRRFFYPECCGSSHSCRRCNTVPSCSASEQHAASKD